jgi:O-antigen ligase
VSFASLLPTRVRNFSENHSSNIALWVGVGFFALYTLAALMGAKQILMMIMLGILACIGVVVLRLPVVACAIWVLIAGSTPEMWISNIHPGSENLATALVKVSGLGLVAICILRYGLVLDLFNPGLAFVLMFFIGLGHGLYPALTLGDSIRSLIGGAAPFAFSFSRLSRRWTDAVIEAVIWVPTLILGFGLLLAAAHLRPFLIPDEGGSVRLGGSTHPAFLGGYAMTAVYACLIELYRNGRNRYLYLLILNFAILFGSGARSPLGCAVMVVGLAFIAIRSESFTLRKRVLPMLLGLLALPVLLAVAATSKSIRLLTVLSGNAEGLSGRDVIWPYFEAAFAQSPIFGWGVGTGKVVVDPDSLTAKLLGTTAAHNEYLRIGVDGGYVGIALVMGFMTIWTWYWSRGMNRSDRIIVRLIMFGFALQSITDNTLIAATASVLFTWISAVFARGRIESREGKPDFLSAHPDASLDLLPGRA